MTRLECEILPMDVIEADAEGEIEVHFKWSPGEAESGRFGPPEHWDPGSSDDFTINKAFYVLPKGKRIPLGLSAHEEELVLEWLDENFERPDFEAERADYLYDLKRDEELYND